jgi:tRNA pseudouridine38-40 synthase
MYYYKILLSYEGSSYYGWQRSLEGPSIQSTLEEALSKMLSFPVSIEGASRTDRGVHAKGQVATFPLPFPLSQQEFLTTIAPYLPSDISIWDLCEVEPHFHPSLSARSKTYEYTLHPSAIPSPFTKASSWQIPPHLSLALMEEITPSLINLTDFTPLSCSKNGIKRDPHCHLKSITLHREGPLVKIEITGNRFLYKMARCIAGTLTYVGLGKISPNDSFSSKVTAPAHALCLKEIFYE